MGSLVPSILSTTEEDFKKKVSIINNSKSPDLQWIHIDLMDNKFVQNQSITPDIVKKYPMNEHSSLTDRKIELHLMVTEPLEWIEQFTGYEVARFILHVEIDKKSLLAAIDYITHNTDSEIGFALNPETGIDRLSELNLENVTSSVLILSVHPGFGGQKFIPEFEKAKKLADFRSQKDLDYLIEEDGGVNIENAEDIIEAGVDNLIVGSSLFTGNFDENIKEIKNRIR